MAKTPEITPKQKVFEGAPERFGLGRGPNRLQGIENETVAEIGVSAELSPSGDAHLLPRRHGDDRAIDIQACEQASEQRCTNQKGAGYQLRALPRPG
jgi:hypothetical protein